jgi:3-hydroxy acid dehydrogenase/malonic semialdehyde reductase
MNNLSNKFALITGASSGIGKAMALALDGKVAEMVLVARRKDKLHEVASLVTKSIVHIVPADINDPRLGELISKVSQNKINILINNAGLALGREKVEASRLEDWDQMISTNITANFKMVHLVLPWMLASGGGDIINLCSVAGHYTYSGGAIYCATKHAVNAFTRVLREETCGRNIRVMQISPGMVETDFSKVRFKGDESAANSVYANMTPLTGEDIARMMTFMLEQPRHVVIDEIITMPSDQGSPTTVSRRNS